MFVILHPISPGIWTGTTIQLLSDLARLVRQAGTANHFVAASSTIMKWVEGGKQENEGFRPETGGAYTLRPSSLVLVDVPARAGSIFVLASGDRDGIRCVSPSGGILFAWRRTIPIQCRVSRGVRVGTAGKGREAHESGIDVNVPERPVAIGGATVSGRRIAESSDEETCAAQSRGVS
jgi:hypothetical protein